MMEQKSYIKINKTTWKRKEHFEFFLGFQQPLWGITTEINCTAAYAYCKAYGKSFFYYYLYQSLKAANKVQAFRLRIDGEDLLEYEHLNGSVTVMRPDETFGFAYFEYLADYQEFEKQARIAIEKEKYNSGLQTDSTQPNVIHYSVLPYLSFTQMQPVYYGPEDNIPKITFGKYRFEDKQVWLPFSVYVHHSLCDGIDIGKFVQAFQGNMDI